MNIPCLKDAVSAEEWQIRVDLVAAYRLVAAYGWSDVVFTHLSARMPGPAHAFLINPYGLIFEEITASSLVLIDQQCNKLRESPFPVNPADAQSGSGDLNLIGPGPMAANANIGKAATAGQGPANLAWPALLRKLDRENPGYDQ